MTRRRARIRFRKEGDLRFISHRDLVRTVERLFRRANLALAQSQGFHPKPRMTFAAALAVGMIGADELLEVELVDDLAADEIRSRLEGQAPPGFVLMSVDVLPAGAAKTRVQSLSFEIEVPAERQSEVAERIAGLLAAESHLAAWEDGTHPIDIRPALDELALENNRLRMRLRVNPQGGARPRAVLAALDIEDLPEQGYLLTRTAVELEP